MQRKQKSSMANLQEQCRDPVAPKVVVDQITNMKPRWIFLLCFQMGTTILSAQELYKAPAPSTKTIWISPENPSGKEGAAGKSNQGAKGSAFFTVKAGEQLVMMDVKGSGIVRRWGFQD